MKEVILASLLLLFIGCSQPTGPSGKHDSIIGRYVFAGKDEFSQASDTLTISIYNSNTHVYKIVRTTGYNRIDHGVKLPRQFIQHEMVVSFNKDKMQLLDDKTGRIFSFNADQDEILLGTAVFKKFK